ncbi:MAG: [Clostridia bacterium]|nr:[FeFe] hydrogenase, group A [Clostridia bacterium]
MAEMIKVLIDGKVCEAPAGTTIIECARLNGIEIPSLCYLKGLNAIGSCRVCLVEVKGARGLAAACVYPIEPPRPDRVTGEMKMMEIRTNTPALQKARKGTLELILSNHDQSCLSCSRSGTCELQSLAAEYGVDATRFGVGGKDVPVETSSLHMIRDNNKCILCRRCVAACKLNQDVGVIAPVGRGINTRITCAFDMELNNGPCVSCGQCITVCPTGALHEKDNTDEVWAALADPTKHVVVGTAPSVRATLGECFGDEIGTNVEGKMVAALRRLGFDGVFDVDTAADVTIMEEGTEFIGRVKAGGPFPMFTSCSPGWVKFCEYYYPDYLENLSTAKSPQGMFGALMKSYYAQKKGIDPKDIVVVSVMPCTAKKFEAKRPELGNDGLADIDISITTRELSRMIKKGNIVWDKLPDEEFDPIFGIASGAAHIFGATGGVMEAALRTVAEILENKQLEKLDFTEVRGTKGIKEATYTVAGIDVKVAVASGLSNARKLIEMIRSGEKFYHFVEIMACPGGCVNGGGQPTQPASVRNNVDLRAKRAAALYNEDAAMGLRKSHENPVVKEIYDTYLGEPGSHKAHELLHTHYVAREKYTK